MATRDTTHESPIVVVVAIIGNFAIAISKFVAAALTGSSSMISEGVHSLVDTGNQVLLLFGVHRSRRAPDSEHPFGHGKELYFWSLIVATVLFGAGGGISIYEGVTHILKPSPIEDPTVSYAVLAVAFVIEGISWTVAAREMVATRRGRGILEAIRDSKDPSTVTVLFEDSAALLGLITAAIGIFLAERLGDPRIDGAGSLVIGVLLAVVAIALALQSRGLLIGERAEPELVEQARAALLADAAIRDVGRIRTMHLGPHEILMIVQARFESERTSDAAEAIGRVRDNLEVLDTRLTDVTIEPLAD